MSKVYTNMPSDDLKMKIVRAREFIRNKESRNIRCPYCKHIAFVVFAGSTGYVETKCRKCKHEVLVDLISMRKMNRQ